MTRGAIFKLHGLAVLGCALLLLDCIVNLLLSIVLLVWGLCTGQEGAPASAYETLSARAGRGMLNRKWASRICGWVIDRVFALWQGPVAELPCGRTFTHPSHCVRAFIKTRDLAYLPADYHGPLPPSLEACYTPRDSSRST